MHRMEFQHRNSESLFSGLMKLKSVFQLFNHWDSDSEFINTFDLQLR